MEEKTRLWQRRRAAVAVLTLLALMVAACAEEVTPEPTEPPVDTEPADEAPPDEEVAPDWVNQEITIEVWDLEVTNPGRNAVIQTLIDQFQDLYPNVTIERRTEPFEDYRTTIRLASTGDDPPDLFQTGQGHTHTGPLVAAGALLPLNTYADQYGWWDRYPEGAVQQLLFTEDGQDFGRGNIYGVSVMGELVGFFYNRTILAEAGIEVPTTFEEFEAALATLRDRGEIPIMFGNLDQWPGIIMFGQIQNVYGDRDELRAYMHGEGTFDTDANRQAAAKAQEWVENGYFVDGFAGLGYFDAVSQFVEGEGAFLGVGGSWLTSQIEEGLGEDAGFILLPPRQENPAWGATGSFSSPFAISARADNPDALAALLDFMTGEAAVAGALANYDIPAFGLREEDLPGATPHGDLLRAWQLVQEEDALVYFLDWAYPAAFDVTTANVAELMGGQVTPEEFVQSMQAGYRDQFGD